MNLSSFPGDLALKRTTRLFRQTKYGFAGTAQVPAKSYSSFNVKHIHKR
jgi:hypothetical protein